jgi:hypothetical protein
VGKMIGQGLIVLGSAATGGGIYGLVLYHVDLVVAVAAIACGGSLIGLGLLLGGRVRRKR